MTERLCTYDQAKLDERGKPTPGYIHLYEEWGAGQIGTIVLGNIPIHRESLEAKGNAIIDKDSKAWDPVEAFKPVVTAAKKHGSIVIGQLTAGGRQTPLEVNERELFRPRQCVAKTHSLPQTLYRPLKRRIRTFSG